MGAFAPSADPAVAATDDDDNLIHLICACDPDRGLCGVNLAGAPVVAAGDCPDEPRCVVCVDLGPLPCERCGEPARW